MKSERKPIAAGFLKTALIVAGILLAIFLSFHSQYLADEKTIPVEFIPFTAENEKQETDYEVESNVVKFIKLAEFLVHQIPLTNN